ncbi:CinA family protein [Pseudarthrobacter sp. J1763]|uniref:CinA family protein n=1 Tax=Pseudarthrobacter sp. J1763 TaxID=3420445 RepID=UPI003D2D59B3
MSLSAVDQLAADVVLSAVRQNLTIATAESLTAGQVAATLANISGASAAFRGGVVAYHNDVKAKILGVDSELLATAGSVDPNVALAMAAGAREACGADLAVSTTGVAGPDPHDGKSVGTVFIAVASATSAEVFEYMFDGDRGQIRAESTEAALRRLFQALDGALDNA